MKQVDKQKQREGVGGVGGGEWGGGGGLSFVTWEIETLNVIRELENFILQGLERKRELKLENFILQG